MRPLELRRAESGQPSPAGSTPILAVNFPPQLCKSPLQPRLLAPVLKTSGNQIIHSPALGFQKSAFVCEVICWLSVHLPPAPPAWAEPRSHQLAWLQPGWLCTVAPGLAPAPKALGFYLQPAMGPRALRMESQPDLLSSPNPGSEDLTALGTSPGSPQDLLQPQQAALSPSDAPAPPQGSILAASSHGSEMLSRQMN